MTTVNSAVTGWKLKILMVFLSVTLTLGIVAVSGHFIKIGGERLNKKLFLKAWFLKTDLFGPSEIGIFQADPQYGWRHKPLSIGHHFEPYGFDVKYTIDGQSNRITHGKYGLPEVLFLGCSFTFGHGAEDNENYVSLLSENFPEYKLANGAVMGWGTTHAWMRLKEELAKNIDVKLVVYGFIGHQQQRNYLRRDWLETVNEWGRKNPYFEVRDGKIVPLGLASPASNTLSDENLLVPKEKEITLQLITEMQANCAERNIPFLLVYLPDGGNLDFSKEILTVVPPENFLDLRPSIDFLKVKNTVDGHLSAKGYREVALGIEPFLKNALKSSASLSSTLIGQTE